jgi:KDO2-lipid IV(A) lauroyltransferase
MKKRKGKPQQIIEYIGLSVVVAVVRVLPLGSLRTVCGFLGDLLYAILPRRRRIAVNNLKIAFGGELNDREIMRLARRSCQSFFLMAAEVMRSPFRFNGSRVVRDRRYRSEHLEELFLKAKKIHDEAGGCIFVTPHLGNWEMLPYASALIGIPLAVVMRPMDNPYLERTILSSRVASGQVVIPKRNAMFVLERMLRQGKSLGILPDQSTGRGLRVKFFGREATVTPIPAVLAIAYKRPIVVVAACRTSDPYYFEGYVSDPIVPGNNPGGEQAEIVRITTEINEKMEEIIRKYPEQYLWMHNRWKETWRKPIFSGH